MTNKLAMNDDELDLVSGGTILPYIVQLGDSLQTIAAKFHVTPEQLADWNNLQNTNSIDAGQRLNIKY